MPTFSSPSLNSVQRRCIWISTGGSGGHLFPALACAAELQEKMPELSISFIGGGIKRSLALHLPEDIVQISRSKLFSFPYKKVACSSALSLRHPLKSLRALLAISQGTYSSYRMMRPSLPDAVVGFGSYFSLPPLLAARCMRIPLFLHAADSVPGKVIRHFSRYAQCSFVQFPEALPYLKGPGCSIKMAVREQMHQGKYSREEAARGLGAREDMPTLLVFGGSQGARALNKAMEEVFKFRLKRMQILHYTGDESVVESLRALYTAQGHSCVVKSYEPRLELAWTLADAAITRAGASTLAELIEQEVPTLLIPYPYAADQHQEKNGQALMNAGAGVEMLLEKELTTKALVDSIERMVHKPQYQETLRQRLKRYKQNAPKESMAEVILHQLYGKV